MGDGVDEVQWAPRVSRNDIRRLYESSASGLLDEEILDEVGITLLLRSESILAVGGAERGEVECPRCRKLRSTSLIARTSSSPDEVLECSTCSWHTTWGAYLKTYQGKQLSPGKISEALVKYMTTYRRASSPMDKMLAIDALIHEFHWNLVKGKLRPTRAACVNLIEGRLGEVIRFLNDLTHGGESGSEMDKTRSRWANTLRSADD
jgi:ribosomal protein L37AE/L43A